MIPIEHTEIEDIIHFGKKTIKTLNKLYKRHRRKTSSVIVGSISARKDKIQ